MSEKPTACVKCDASLQQPLTGRPRQYCGRACRSAAAYEIRRITRRLERLETERANLRPLVARGGDGRDVYGRRHPEQLVDCESEIVLAEQRLRCLLGDGVDAIAVEPARVRAIPSREA